MPKSNPIASAVLLIIRLRCRFSWEILFLQI